jgi:hypothetical protein
MINFGLRSVSNNERVRSAQELVGILQMMGLENSEIQSMLMHARLDRNQLYFSLPGWFRNKYFLEQSYCINLKFAGPSDWYIRNIVHKMTEIVFLHVEDGNGAIERRTRSLLGRLGIVNIFKVIIARNQGNDTFSAIVTYGFQRSGALCVKECSSLDDLFRKLENRLEEV